MNFMERQAFKYGQIGSWIFEEMMDNLTVGLGYSFNAWKGLYVEPNYSMGLKEDENGEREGTFNLGLAYRF